MQIVIDKSNLDLLLFDHDFWSLSEKKSWQLSIVD